jgi:Na+/proline symporter
VRAATIPNNKPARLLRSNTDRHKHRFHGAQTITVSVTLGLATLYYTWGPSFLARSTPPALAKQRRQDSLRTAVFTGTIYWLAGLASISYPGTDGIDPEFGPSGFPQAPIFVVFASLAVLGWLMERRV